MNNKQAIASCKAEATKDTEGINKGEETMPSPQQITLMTNGNNNLTCGFGTIMDIIRLHGVSYGINYRKQSYNEMEN